MIVRLPALALLLWTAASAAAPYQDDEAIVSKIAALGHGEALLLPAVNVNAGDLALHGVEKGRR